MAKVEESSQLATDESPPAPSEWQGDPLSGFPAEAEVASAAARSRKRTRLVYTSGAVLAVLLIAAVFVGPRVRSMLKGSPDPGTLTFESSPPGVQVLEGGRDLGVTPLTLSLSPGPHTINLRRGTAERALAVEVRSGATVVHHVEMDEAPRTGRLRVDSSPPGASVEVDGTTRGTAPLDVTSLEPGEHDVTVRSGNVVFSQRVSISAGGAASLMVPLVRPEAGAAGWVTVSSPIEVQLYEGQALVGSSRMERVMLRAGSRTLRLVNAQTGFETTARVQIQAGAGTRLPVKLPNGQLSVNAAPWAEVFLDGRPIGQTPIANFSAQIGSHEIVLRHPRYAEQRRTVVVSVAAPVRVGVDLRQ